MKDRYLVGRRYEDFIRHGIEIRLTDDEIFWRMAYDDPRLQSLIDRRKQFRRQEDMLQEDFVEALRPQCSFTFLDQLLTATR